MTDEQVKGALVDEVALQLTMWAEARGDWRQGNSSLEERVAVGCVVRNRLPRFMSFRAEQRSIAAVCFAPHQFSCWEPAGGTSNYGATMAAARAIIAGVSIDNLLEETLYLARGIISGVILDRTGGATMYYAPDAMIPRDKVPASAHGKTTLRIGAQVFYA